MFFSMCDGISEDTEYISLYSVVCGGLLFTHPVYNNLHLGIPNAHPTPPSILSPLAAARLFSAWEPVSLL